MFETSLRNEGQRRLSEIGVADLLVGIPSYKNAETIGHVVETAGDGMLVHFPKLRPAIAVVDGGSSDETVHVAANRPLPPTVRRIVTTYQGIQGKGSAVRAILEIARALGVKACIILEADLTSLTRDWIQRLAAPILNREFDLAIPWYARPLVEGGVNDLLGYPLTRMLYGSDLRQPMAGDFAVSGELAARIHDRDVWETDVARQGIGIWLATIGINENMKMCQVRLGPKIEHKKEAPILIDPTFVQTVGTQFRMMDIYKKRWPLPHETRSVPIYGESDKLPEPAKLTGTITMDMLNDAFHSGARRTRRLWRTVLAPSNLEQVFDLANRPRGGLRFPPDLWARVVFDSAVVYNKGENDPDKVALGLLPMYYARAATVLRETGAKLDAVEQAIQEQARVFAEQKPYLLYRWDTFVPWAVDGVR
ncbi:MAG: glycosyltransferase [Chloroflexi bacterium]|nr:glycosyltransferase [Chloroflexota bacterium]